VSFLRGLPVHHPRKVLAVISVVTLWMIYLSAGLSIDSSIENLLPTHDPERTYFDEVKEVFGSDDASVIGVFADDVFARSTLAKIDTLSERLAAIDAVREVISVTTVKGVQNGEDGVSVGRLMSDLPQTDEEAAALRTRVLQNPFYAGHLVSKDSRATVVVALFENLSDKQFLERDIEGQVRAAVTAAGAPEEYAITGLQTLKVSGARLMNEDLQRFLPVSFVVVVVILGWGFRTVRGVCLPLSAVLIGIVWTTGTMTLLGSSINLGTLVLPPLLMAIGIAEAIHIISRYYLVLRPGLSREEIVEDTLSDIGIPIVAAGVTTMIGFVTLAFNPIAAIREFGFYATFGIATIFMVSLLFIPAALVLLPQPKRMPVHTSEELWVSRLLRRLGTFAIHHRRAVLSGAAVLVVISLIGATRIRVETDYLGFLSLETPIRRDNARIAEKLGGTQPISIVVDGDGPNSVKAIDTLSAIRDLQAFIAEQPSVDASLSVVDFLTIVRATLNPDAPPGLPTDQGEVNQLLVFVSAKDLRPVVNADFSRANIIVGTRLSGSAEVSAFVNAVEAYAKTRFRRGLSVRATGTVALLNRSADVIARGQISGIWQSLLVLLILMSGLFLSVRAGFLSLVPNIWPIILLFGVMGWFGISLNIATSMIAAIAIGIAMDDTIHYLSQFNKEIRRTGNEEEAVRCVAQSVGLPIMITALVLFAGFLVVCQSNFLPIRHFGILASTTMLIAVFGDLLITPALLVTAHIVTVWDLMYTRLGSQPHKEIPLFFGLRPFQAKIVVLMGQLAKASPGTLLTRKGELKVELYVILTGEVRMGQVAGGVLRTMGRGDAIGEMGLVRHLPRSADLVVTKETEYLVLDAAFLDRIQRRYPRIAAKVFLNLTRILSDRLENTTDQLMRIGAMARQKEADSRPTALSEPDIVGMEPLESEVESGSRQALRTIHSPTEEDA